MAVTKPTVSGPQTTTSTQDVEFLIGNLDVDVTSVVLGPHASGCEVADFVNNGDGTGQLLINVTTAGMGRLCYVSVFAVSATATSSESNWWAIYSLPATGWATELSIVPAARAHDAVYERILAAGIRQSEFYAHRGYILPYRSDETTFELKSVVPGTPVTISCFPVLGSELGPELQHSVIPTEPKTLVRMRLPKSISLIVATDGTNSTTITVTTSIVALVADTYAREIFNNQTVLIDDIQRAIDSPTTTRILEPYMPWLRMLPTVDTLKTLGAKIGIRSLIHQSGHTAALRDVVTAVTASTPAMEKIKNYAGDWLPYGRPLYSAQEHYSGSNLHCWTSNLCETRRSAVLKYLSNQSAFTVLRADEDEIAFVDSTGTEVRHRFDVEGLGCDAFDPNASGSCMDAVVVDAALTRIVTVLICAASYPMDLVVDTEGGSPYPFTPLVDEDGAGGLDPGWDGWDGFSVTRRFDGGASLDSTGPVESGGTECVYSEYIVRAPTLISCTFPEVAVSDGIDGSYTVV